MPPTNTASVLIDAAELGRMLLVSKPTIWRMREDGKLPPAIALTSQCIRWRRSDIEAWLAAGCPTQQQDSASCEATDKVN